MRTSMLHDHSTPPLPQERRSRPMRSVSAATIGRYSVPSISNGRIITIPPPPPPPTVPPPPPPRIISGGYPTIRSTSQSMTLLSQSTTETIPMTHSSNNKYTPSQYKHQYNKYTTYHHHHQQHHHNIHNMHGLNPITPRNQHFYANYGYPKCHSTKTCKNKRFFGTKYPPPTPPPRPPRSSRASNNNNSDNNKIQISQTPKPRKKKKIRWNDKELQQKQQQKQEHNKQSQSAPSILNKNGSDNITFYVTMNGILTYSVIYDTNICGLELYPFDTVKMSGAVIIKCHNLYSESRVICNSLLIGIGDKIVINMNYNKILKTIRFAQRPLKLTFHPPPKYIDDNNKKNNNNKNKENIIKKNNNLTLWLGVDNNIHFKSHF